MKDRKLRSPLLAVLILVAAFIAAWLPASPVQSGRAAQDGVSGYDTPVMPPDDELRVGPYSNYNNPHLAGPEDPVEVVIELEEPPAIEAFRRERGVETRGGRANPRAIAAAQAQMARINQAQQRLVAALAAPRFNARITGRVQRVYNGVTARVASGRLSEVLALPGVKAVHFPELIYPATDTSVPFIGAHRAWDPSLQGGYRGEGITIAVIDSGIDYTHANLGGSGNPADFNSNNPTIIGDNANFPNIKVIGGIDLVGDNYNAADQNNNIPNPDPDPCDCRSHGHGTAVAGIAAGIGVAENGSAYVGDYNQNTNFSSFRIGPGVAPKANLFAIRVFGCNARGAASNAVVTQAIERAMDPNQDGDFSDRIQVVILPGGGPFTTLPNSPVIAAINNGAAANVIYVGALGNGGDTHLAAGGPALAEGALGVVANADNGLFTQNIRVNSPGNIAGIYTGAVTEFGFPLNLSYTRTTVLAVPNDGCAPLTNGSQINGAIAFIDSGGCTPTTKARNAQAAGAVAAIIANNTAALPVHVRDDGTGSDITIPSFLISQTGGDAIRAELNAGQTVNISLTPGDVTSQAGLGNSYASFNPYGGVYFSSRGPTTTNDVLKPDIAAPGVNIDSARAGSGNNYSYLSGTSMAAPPVAGTAALIRQKYPDYTTQQIYDIIRSTGTGVFSGANSAQPERGPSLVGGGGVNAEAAIKTVASVNNSQTDTATNLSGEIIEALGNQTQSRRVRFAWYAAEEANYNVTLNTIAAIPGVNVTIPNQTGTAPRNSIFNIEYLLNVNSAAMKRQCPSWVSATQSGNARHCLPEAQGKIIFNLEHLFRPPFAAVYYNARPASQMGTQQTSINLTETTGLFTLNLTGQGVNNGPTLPADWRSFLSPFELQCIDPNDALTPPELDYFDLQDVGIRKVGDRLIFGVSTYGDWRSHNEIRFNVFFDIDRDGRDDFHLFNTSIPNAQGAPSDVPVTRLFNINTQTFVPQTFFLNSFSPATLDSALYYTNVAALPVAESLLDLNGPFNYTVKTSFGNLVIDESAVLTYDAANPGLDFGTSTMFNDVPGGTIQTSYNLSNFLASNSEGALFLHHFNTRGNRAQVLPSNLGLEGDVDGDGDITYDDVLLAAGIVIAAEPLNLGSQFQRFDTAPRINKGDGAGRVTDVVQTWRYVDDLDPPTSAGGPIQPASSPSQSVPQRQSVNFTSGSGQARTLRAVSAGFIAGQTNTLDIEIDALGGENGFGFSLEFDPGVLSFVGAEPGDAAPSQSLQAVNPLQTAVGRLGLALVLPPGQGLEAGTRRIARVNFNVLDAASAATTQIAFGDAPALREVASVNADEVPTSYTGAQVSIIRTAAHVSAASFSGAALAGESIIAAFGTMLATATEAATTLPLPTNLAGTTVSIRDSAGADHPALLFFVSAGQINYALPVGVALGPATITITSGSGAVSVGDVMIETVAPGLFAANATGDGVAAAQVLRVTADGAQIFEPTAVFDAGAGRFIAAPIDLGPEGEQVFLVLFGTGVRFRSDLAAVQLSVGGTNLEALYAGPQGVFVGLDQINALLPRSLAGRGAVQIAVAADGRQANIVEISIR